MRIGFNGQRLAGQRFGVGRYVEYLLRHWGAMLPDEDELTVFLRQPLPDGPDEFGPRVGTELLRYRGSGIPWENMHLRRAASKLDVLFCPAYTAPLLYRGPLVVATHSVNETEAQAHSMLYRQTYSRIHRHSARIADMVVVPGLMTKDAVVNCYGIPEERIAIVHQGADDVFRPLDDRAVAEATRRRFFSDGRPYILFVGKGSQRRNIPMLVAAFAKLKAEGFPHGLVLFGPYKGDQPLERITTELGVSEHVHQTDGVLEQHSDIVPVYASADVFVHPSENEGWSMTTVEAMACGTPVIAWGHGSVPEIIEDSVTGFIVESEAEAVAALNAARELSPTRIRAAFEARFTARRMAEDYLAIYEELAPSQVERLRMVG